jgi:hypothetical protein
MQKKNLGRQQIAKTLTITKMQSRSCESVTPVEMLHVFPVLKVHWQLGRQSSGAIKELVNSEN